jgi:hypothetical protein
MPASFVYRSLSTLIVASVCGAAGWLAGRAAHEGMQPAGRAPRQAADGRAAGAGAGAGAAERPGVPADSPAGKWIARAKGAAGAEEFAALLEEIPALFPPPASAKKKAAMLWLLGQWISRDAEGAYDYVAGKSRDSTLQECFGMMLGRVAPAKVEAILQKSVLQQTPPFTAEGLAAIMNSGLARDAGAVRDWLNGLKDAELRHRAQHAWLAALAKRDAAAAQRESEKMDAGAWLKEGDGRVAVVAALARENLPAAVREMKRLTDLVKATKSRAGSSDPFASPPQEVWWAVQEAVASGLPRDSAKLLPALREIGKDCEMDGEQRESLQRRLADIKIEEWNTETALEAMKLLLPASSAPQDSLSDTLRDELSKKVTRADPELSLQYYASLSEAGRKELGFDFIRGIIDARNPAFTLRLAALVHPGGWSMSGANTLAGKLGETPEAGKAIIEALPVNGNNASAHADFAGRWARSDPDAAAQWVASRPEDLYAAQGLAESWAGFDDTGASAWAAGLPEGKLRDGAARGLVNAIASLEPETAWRWAADISSPWQAAQAYRDLAKWWGNKAPPEFVAALNEAMKHGDASDSEAALESLKQPPPERYINP